MKKFFSFVLILMISLSILTAGAESLQAAGISDAFGDNLKKFAETGAGYKTATKDTLFDTIGKVVQLYIMGAGMIFFGLMIYAGFEWMQAKGEEEKVKKAQETIKNAVIGLILTIAAYAISFMLMKLLGENALTYLYINNIC